LTEITEDRVFTRYPRRRGAVLIIGVGAVGSHTAHLLARMGISPLWLFDFDVVEEHNLARQAYSAEDLGQNKAQALAARLRREFPLCDATAVPKNFVIGLSEYEQLRYVRAAGVVIAATDQGRYQRHINEVCVAAEVTAVYPGVWVDERVRDAEVGEILWVLPGRHTPCYECAFSFRQGIADVQAGAGFVDDILLVALTTAQVTAALLEPDYLRSGILDPARPLIYVHGFTPTSGPMRPAFPVEGLLSRSILVPFPPTPCRVCGGSEAPPAPPAGLPPGGQALPRPHDAGTASTPVLIGDVIRDWFDTSRGTTLAELQASRRHRPSATGVVLRGILPIVLLALLTLFIVWLVKLASPHSQATGPNPATLETPAAPHHAAGLVPPRSAVPVPSSTRPALAQSHGPAIDFAGIGLSCASECGVIGMTQDGRPPVVDLDITGISGTELQYLCSQGYIVRWSDNYGQDFTDMKLGAICDYQLVDVTAPDVASESIPRPVNKYGLGIAGPWTITFQLVAPSGRIVVEASYRTTVVGCSAPVGGCAS
jgi:ThiF family